MKLFKAEPWSDAIAAALTEWPELVSAEILDVEVTRVARNYGLEQAARAVVSAVNLIPMDEPIRAQLARSVRRNYERWTRFIWLRPSRSVTASA